MSGAHMTPARLRCGEAIADAVAPETTVAHGAPTLPSTCHKNAKYSTSSRWS